MWRYKFYICIPILCIGGWATLAVAQSHMPPKQSSMPDIAPSSVQVTHDQDGTVESFSLRTEDYLEIMRQQHRLPEARDLLLRLFNASQQPETKGQMAYYLGMVAFEMGEYAQAEDWYRQTLEYLPNYMWALLELGGTLFLLEKYEASRYYFELVKKNTADAQVLQTAHVYLQQIATKRKFDYTFNVGLYPNNNVNNAPQVENYQFFGRTVTPTERPKSAVGITYDMSVYYKKRGRKNDIYTLTLAPTGVKYQDHQYDQTMFTVRLSRFNQLEKGYTTQKIHMGRSFYGGFKDRKIWGIAYTKGWYVGQKTVLSLTGDWGHTNLINGNYDVFKTAIVPRVQYHINTVSSASLSLNRTRTSHDLSQRTGTQNGYTLGYNHTLKNGVDLSPSLFHNRFVSDGIQTGLGGVRIRETTGVNLDIKLTPYPILNFVPTVKLGASRVDSTIKMDRAKNNTFNLIFKRTF